MGNRVVYGNSFSSDGWPMVDEGSCTWVNVPGTGVTLQIQNGWPLAILRAFAADFNAFVEPLRDADSACWTPTNSVSTSNHLSGTAMDLNWDSHPFYSDYGGFNAAEIATMRELLDFYEGMVFWGQDWSSPKDPMHIQLASLANGGVRDTYNNPATGDFIARKIRADGFSTFRRGNAPVVSVKDQHTLDIIREGQRRSVTPRGIQIALATGLVESNITIYANERVPESMSIPHGAVGSDAYSVGIFQQQVRDTGDGWWWGDAATCMDPTLSAGLFYARLVTHDYNGPDSPGSYAQAVQSSAFPDRYDERFQEAVDLYNRLANLATDTGDGFLMALPDADQITLRDRTNQIWGALFNPVESTSIYANPTPGDPGNMWPSKDLPRNDDGFAHEEWVEKRAKRGDSDAIRRVALTASGKGRYKDQSSVNNAASVLAEIEKSNPEFLQSYLNGASA